MVTRADEISCAGDGYIDDDEAHAYRDAERTQEETIAAGRMLMLHALSEAAALGVDELADAFSLKTRKRIHFVSGFALDMLRVPYEPKIIQPLHDGRTNTLSYYAKKLAALKLETMGAFFVKDVLEKKQSEMLHGYVLEQLQNADDSRYFGTVAKRKHRYDYALNVEDPVLADVLADITGMLGPTLEMYLGPNPELVEYSALVPFHGAEDQAPHRDTAKDIPQDEKQRSKIVSCFVYFSDVSKTAGALDIWPGTQSHLKFTKDRIFPLLQELGMYDGDTFRASDAEPSVRVTASAGSVVCYDSSLMHRGSANREKNPRIAVQFSYMQRSGIPPIGSTFSLRKKFLKKYSILNGELHPYPEKSIAPQFVDMGRFCFGTLNGRREELEGKRSIAKFPMCTEFKFNVEEFYHVELSYNRSDMNATIAVNGNIEATEIRGMAWANGPLTVNFDCHNFDTPDGFASPFGGTTKNLLLAKSKAQKPLVTLHDLGDLEGPQVQIVEHVKMPPLGESGTIYISLDVKPNTNNNLLYHAIFLVGGGEDEFGPRECSGMDALSLVWSATKSALVPEKNEVLDFLKRDLDAFVLINK